MSASSWNPVPLGTFDAASQPQPSICGVSYPGVLALHYGEPEAVKTWLNLILCLFEIRRGHHTLWIDFEMAPGSIAGRLRDLGATDDELERFLYVQPAEPIGDAGAGATVDELIATYDPTLCVIDAMAGALALHGYDGRSGSDVEAFYRGLVARLRVRGAAVHVIDHVTKDRETRGRWPIDSQRKLGGADVGLSIEMVTPFGRGRHGVARVRVTKDRHGSLARPLVAELQLTSDPDTNVVTWAFADAHSDDAKPSVFRPTVLMDRVLEYLSAQTEPVSRKTTTDAIRGKREWVINAIDALVADGRVTENDGPRRAKLLSLVPVPGNKSEQVGTSQQQNGEPHLFPVPLLQGEQVREQVAGTSRDTLKAALATPTKATA